MMNIENNLNNIGKVIRANNSCINAEYVLKKCSDPNYKMKQKKLKPAHIIILALVICLITTTVYASFVYFFTEHGAIGKAEENGYANIYTDKFDVYNGIQVTLKAILTDGFTTYVRLQFDGVLPEVNNSSLPEIGQKYQNPMIKYIENVWISDTTGKKFEFKNQIITHFDNGGTVSIGAPTLFNGKLEKNEVILEFINAPTKSKEATIELKLLNVEHIFKISDIKINVPPFIIRDVSSLNLIYNIPYARGIIKKITYTVFGTKITLDWTVEEGYINNINKFMDNYENIYIQNGVKVWRGFMFLPDASNRTKYTTKEFNIDKIISPDNELIIYYKSRTQDKTYEYQLVIPAQE